MTIEQAIELLKAGRYNALEYLQAKNIAVKAMEKQSAKTVTESEICPSCKTVLQEQTDYCKYCGQKLNWKGR